MNFYFSLSLFILSIQDLKATNWIDQGPIFIYEPPGKIDFMNDTGTVIDCSAHGSPDPIIEWLNRDQKPIQNLNSRILQILRNGSLYFPQFKSSDYSQSIHASIYICRASNMHGSIISRQVNIRAVVRQQYQVQVYDEYVIKGNTAVLKCHIPSFVTDYVRVTSWVTDNNIVLRQNMQHPGRYSIFPSGYLHIRNVRRSDQGRRYWCITRHQLTGEAKKSDTSGKLVIKEPKGSIPPRITHHEVTVSARRGDTLQLSCAAQGHPVPSYNWFKSEHGKRVIISRPRKKILLLSGSLFIYNAEINDTGQYLCSVQNSVGSKTVTTQLTVTSSLTTFVEPQVQTVNSGDTTSLNCTVSGYPIHIIKWVKNGIEVKKTIIGANISKNFSSLLIKRVDRKHSGMYQCFASNSYEQAQGTSELRLGNAVPVLIDGFQSILMRQGKMIQLSCIFSGNPKPRIDWYVDDQLVKTNSMVKTSFQNLNGGLIKSWLNFTNIQTLNGGLYSCKGSNSRGTTVHSSEIKVYGAPGVRQMKNVTIVAGDTVKIRCHIFGYPISSISWLKDGSSLIESSRFKIHDGGNLTIYEVSPNIDSAHYTCIARNHKGQSAQGSLWILVSVKPVVEKMQSKVAEQGQTVTLMCSVSAGDRPVSKHWMKDGRPIATDIGISITEADVFSALVINSVQQIHDGNYTCVASNHIGSSNKTAQIKVKVAATWKYRPRNLTVHEMSSALFDCYATGFPKPSSKWYKISVSGAKIALEPSGKFKLSENGSLLISNITSLDRGKYACSISNGMGSKKTSEVHLKVGAPPIVSIIREEVRTREGSSINLNCNVVGSSSQLIKWKLNKNFIDEINNKRRKISKYEIPGGIKTEIRINFIKINDKGLYFCIASNRFGRSEDSVKLIVLTKPEKLFNISVIGNSNGTMTVSWSLKERGDPPVRKVILQIKPYEDSWSSDSVKNVSIFGGLQTKLLVPKEYFPKGRHILRLIAVNQLGEGDPSDHIVFTTTLQGNLIVEVRASSNKSTIKRQLTVFVTSGTIVGVLLLLLAIIVIVLMRRSRKLGRRKYSEAAKSKMEREVEQNRNSSELDQYGKLLLMSSSSPGGTGQDKLYEPIRNSHSMAETFYDDVTPYATFQVSNSGGTIADPPTNMLTFQQHYKDNLSQIY